MYDTLTYPFQLPDLDYPLGVLEPHIEARTMEIHHGKHHAGYVAKLNAALEHYPDLQSKTLTDLLRDYTSLPEEIKKAVINNGGGHANHTLFWQVMSPDGGGDPSGSLAEMINETFGGFSSFKEAFASEAATVFGSGWAWLSLDQDGKDLHVGHTPNQNSPLLENHIPLLGIDVWEHAYYLQYQNKRADYIEAWWNVVNWDKVAELYNEPARS
ncbi:superoxide dismutase [candidate division WWE3 bacterium]|uniref:Superoxide dismutase n=1 Tax=candidate division WWE3 bacterium TaxID=2053526 RepID=A0A955RRQ4_UNCKA|nr:superoxide dismutase [candidate division WWE3 bacterium]